MHFIPRRALSLTDALPVPYDPANIAALKLLRAFPQQQSFRKIAPEKIFYTLQSASKSSILFYRFINTPRFIMLPSCLMIPEMNMASTTSSGQFHNGEEFIRKAHTFNKNLIYLIFSDSMLCAYTSTDEKQWTFIIYTFSITSQTNLPIEKHSQ